MRPEKTTQKGEACVPHDMEHFLFGQLLKSSSGGQPYIFTVISLPVANAFAEKGHAMPGGSRTSTNERGVCELIGTYGRIFLENWESNDDETEM